MTPLAEKYAKIEDARKAREDAKRCTWTFEGDEVAAAGRCTKEAGHAPGVHEIAGPDPLPVKRPVIPNKEYFVYRVHDDGHEEPVDGPFSVYSVASQAAGKWRDGMQDDECGEGYNYEAKRGR